MNSLQQEIKRIVGHRNFCKVPKVCTCNAEIEHRDLLQLFEKFGEKIIGEDDPFSRSFTRSNEERNFLRKQQKAKLKELLGS